nr:hypothecical protein [Trichoderma margaretense]
MPQPQHSRSPNPSDDSSSSIDLHESLSERGSSNAVVRKSNKPLSRRGHFKSRLGCFNCKRRRVKCNEVRPACSPCTRLGLNCSYPTPASTSSSSFSSSSSSSASSLTPRAALSTLALEDLRFYHQFLLAAFPTLPLKAKDVWMDAAAMSHQYDYLAHAVLGLGASHLSQHGNVDYTSQALQHRITAMKLVNEQLDQPPTKPSDADALLAAVICLVTQSSLMPDSMIDYITTTRGGNLVATSIITNYEMSIFKYFTPLEHDRSLERLICEQPRNLEVIEGFHASALRLRPLCQKHTEVLYCESMIKCINKLRTSCLEGHLLIIHMFLLDYVLGNACLSKSDEPEYPGRKSVIINWTRDLARKLPPSYQQYTEWPLEYCLILAKGDARHFQSCKCLPAVVNKEMLFTNLTLNARAISYAQAHPRGLSGSIMHT